ncbi:MAG: DNA repair protein RecO [Candidatus Omnitrophica bacterium]|nr:DNA repair protein RecO [Candidatus Omnitrophota bacterium]
MAIQKTDAIVLKTLPFRSSSLLVTFFSKTHGKVKGIAKGVRQEREMRGSLFELFTQLEIVYYEKTRSDLHLISEGFILESYEPIRSQLETIAYASYFAELVDELTEFHDPHPVIFHLLDFSYRYLPSLSPERLARLFEIQLLREIGWVPYLEDCIRCHAKPSDQPFFSPNQGALLCKNCARDTPDAKPISEETLSVLRYYLQHDLETSIKLSVSFQSEQGLALLMNRFFQFRIHRPLKSLSFLEKIKPVLC